jgi:hypothetical protein
MSRSRIAFQILTYQPQRRRIWEDYWNASTRQ